MLPKGHITFFLCLYNVYAINRVYILKTKNAALLTFDLGLSTFDTTLIMRPLCGESLDFLCFLFAFCAQADKETS